MCGISAIFQFRENTGTRNADYDDGTERREKLETRLDCSIESMRHRGPDAKGVWTSSDGTVGLGHVRLSTRDLSAAGHQPLHSTNEAADIHVVVNGELYYDDDLRTLLQKEYDFQSTSDSEMVIPLYKKYGPDFIHKLRGEFALVLYDGKNQTLFAVRDRFGVKPLHYGIFDGKIILATQCKGIVRLMDDVERLKWDPICLAEGGGHYSNRSLFSNINRVPPGHSITVRCGQREAIRSVQYWHTKFPANEGSDDVRTDDELIREARVRLVEAVRLRLDSTDVPVGLLLSGGVDSSAIAGIAAHLARKRLGASNGNAPPIPTCFTIAFPDEAEMDESSVATRTAEFLELPIEKTAIDEQMLADNFDEACWLGETLMWDMQHIAKKALSRHISSRGFKVVLNGDGGDELFGGYPFYAADRLLEDDNLRAPHLQHVTSTQRAELLGKHHSSAEWFGAEDTAGQPQTDPSAAALHLPQSFCDLAVSVHTSWLKPSVRALSSPFRGIASTFTPSEAKAMASYHPMHRGMLAWNKTILPNMVIAAISDGAEMAHAVESRPPFLDHMVAEFTDTLPVDLLVRVEPDQKPREKWLFREAVKPYVTEEVYNRRKQAFAAPFRWNLGGPLHRKFRELMTRENLEGLGFVDIDQAETVMERAFQEQDELLFRQALWLAQIVSIGLQFGVEKYEEMVYVNGNGVAT